MRDWPSYISLAIQPAERTEEDGAELVFEGCFLVVWSPVRPVCQAHLSLHGEAVVPLPVSVGPVDSPGQMLQTGETYLQISLKLFIALKGAHYGS